MLTAEQWRSRATDAVIALLTAEGAATQRGMEAKLSDQRYPGIESPVFPHHLTTARRRLLDAGVIERVDEVTRGGGTVATFVLADPTKSVQRIAGRKRLLDARYRSWTKANTEWGPAAPIPSALERVIHRSLSEAAPHGYRLLRPDGGEVRQIIPGQDVSGGPLDNAAYYLGYGPDGMPASAVLLPIEAKNIREWVYPRTQELYQLLDKSTRLHQAYPQLPTVPVFVCRRVHLDTGRMAQQLGFHVIETWRQYALPALGRNDEDRRKFDDLNSELGYNLELNDSSVEPMVNQFTTVIPRRVQDAAERWSTFAGHTDVGDLFKQLRDDDLPQDQRHRCLGDLARIAEDVFGEDARWFHDGT